MRLSYNSKSLCEFRIQIRCPQPQGEFIDLAIGKAVSVSECHERKDNLVDGTDSEWWCENETAWLEVIVIDGIHTSKLTLLLSLSRMLSGLYTIEPISENSFVSAGDLTVAMTNILWQVDLGRACRVEEVLIHWWGLSVATSYSVLSSAEPDGSSWEKVSAPPHPTPRDCLSACSKWRSESESS